MHPYAVISLFNATAILGLGFFVYSKSPKARVNTDWLLLSVAAAGWSFGTFLLNVSKSPDAALFWVRILNYFAIFIGPLFIKFCYSIAQKTFPMRLQVLLFGGAIGLSLYSLCFPSCYINGVKPGVYFYFIPQIKWLYYLYTAFFLTSVTYSLLFLYSEFKISKGRRQTQFKYLFVSMLIAFSGGASTLLICYAIEFPYGNFYFSLYAFIMTYAIVAHHLMDIEVIIKRTIVFAGFLLMVMGVVAVVMGITQGYLAQYLSMRPMVSMILAGLIIVGIYEPTRKWLLNLTDRFLFQKKFDYRILLKEASKEMASIKSLKKLARIVVAFIVKKGRIKHAATLVYSVAENSYVMQASRPFIQDKTQQVLRGDHPLIQELKRLQGPLEREGLKQRVEGCSDSEEKTGLLECLELLKRFNAQAAVPSFLYLENQGKGSQGRQAILRSILFLGEKKSDEPYTEEDLDTFFTLAQESAVAIENARLYDDAIIKERQLVELKAEKERKELLGNMTGGIAHELRGPVQLIQLSTYSIKKTLSEFDQLLDESLSLDNKKKLTAGIAGTITKYLERIDQSNDRQQTVASTLETFAKMKDVDLSQMTAEDLSADAFEKQAIDVLLIIKLVEEEARIRFQRRGGYGVDLCSKDVGRQLPPIYGEQNLLKQVFINLLLNAYDAMAKSPEKKIQISASACTEKDAGSGVDRAFIHLEFRDTGPGIPPEIRDKVWDYSFTTKAKAGGSGIGLFWCRLIAEKIHGGKIWFESREKTGTTFHLLLPQVPPAPEPSHE